MLFPLSEGTIEIPPLTFECTIARRASATHSEVDDFFNSGNIVGEKFTRTSPALTLHVSPLPTPAPKGFTGAVGEFSISSNLPTKEVYAGEETDLRFTLRGEGNLKTLLAPGFAYPATAKALSVSQTDSLHVSGAALSGFIVYDAPFLAPQREGSDTIPSTTFVYFSPRLGRYTEIRTAPIVYNILPARAGNEGTKTAEAEGQEGFWAKKWNALKTAEHFGLALIVACVILLLLLVAFLLRKSKVCRALYGIMLARNLAQCLRHKKLPMDVEREGGKFAASLAEDLTKSLSRLSGLPLSGLSGSQIAERLRQEGVSATTSDAIEEFFTQAREISFSGKAPTKEQLTGLRETGAEILRQGFTLGSKG